MSESEVTSGDGHYTIKQATEVLAVDGKTLTAWMNKLGIQSVVNPHDQRARLLSEADLQRLMEHQANQNKSKVPRADTPLGVYERTITELRVRIRLLETKLSSTTDQLQALEQGKVEMTAKVDSLYDKLERLQVQQEHDTVRLHDRIERAMNQVFERIGQLQAQVAGDEAAESMNLTLTLIDAMLAKRQESETLTLAEVEEMIREAQSHKERHATSQGDPERHGDEAPLAGIERTLGSPASEPEQPDLSGGESANDPPVAAITASKTPEARSPQRARRSGDAPNLSPYTPPTHRDTRGGQLGASSGNAALKR